MIKNNRFNAGFFLITAIFFATILLCTRDYNPFEDPSNAKAVFSYKSFDNGDTLNIFSSETLKVSVYVAELIDSFEIVAPGNRFFENGRIIYKSGGKNWQGPGPYNLILSFADTGNKIIDLLSYHGNEEIKDELWCYVRSPLHQNNITGAINERVNLKTNPVGDKDGVIYLWDFGRGSIIRSKKPDTSVVIENAGIDGKGILTVSDGYFISPEAPFTFGLIDTIPPKISFTEDNYIKVGDTIKTSKIDFDFTVVISDRGQRPDSASINGKRFDRIIDTNYIKMFGRIDTLEKPLPVIIYAMDNMSNGNSIADTVFLVYDPQIILQSKFNFNILMPAPDNSFCNTRTTNIYGYISQFSEKAFDDKILFFINGKIKDSIRVTGENKKIWSWTAPLDFDTNTIEAKLFNESGGPLSSLKKVIVYNKNIIDTAPPVILEITTDDGKNDFYVEDSIVKLKVLAFDKSPGIKTLFVNSKPYTISKDNIWNVMVENLRHLPGGNSDTIKAVDSTGLAADTVIKIYLNKSPVLKKWPQPPFPLFVGTNYYDSIVFMDPDGDSVTAGKVDDNTGLTISNPGKIHWTPGINDTGVHDIKVRLSDNIKPSYYTFKIEVVDTLQMRSAVKFENLLGKFPKYLKSERDSLNFTLNTMPGTGKEPLVFHAQVVESSLSLKVDSNRVIWHPVEADTGLKHLKIWVTDHFNNSDTLFPLITIIPKDVHVFIVVNSFNPVDVSAKGKRETRSYRVNVDHTQPDGHYSVYEWQNGIKNNVFVDDSGKFNIVFSSEDKEYGNDAVKLLGQYGDSLSDTLRVPVFYGYQPDTPSTPHPAMDTIINDSIVHFSWNGNKINETGIYYNLYIGSCPEPQDSITSYLQKFDTVLHKSGTYCWRVSASNGKAVADGPVWRFRLRVPGQVKFLTNETDFKAAYEARRDSINVPLKIIQGTGKAPFVFSAEFADNKKPIHVIDGRISFLPDSADTGLRRIIVAVKDSIGNSDTIMPTILITPVNRRCKVHLDTSGLSITGGKLDLSSAFAPETLDFKISDPDPAITERHTITISQLNTIVNGKDDSSGNIYVIVDPTRADISTDLLKVTVVDRAGYVSADSLLIYYGLPPQIPYNPLPQDNSVWTDAVKSLSWNCSDPDGRSLSYDVYFGTTNPPPKFKSGIVTTSVTLPNAADSGKYFWRVSANDSKFRVQSPVWTFSVDSARRDFIINTAYVGGGAGTQHALYNIPVLLRLDTTNFNFRSVSRNGAGLWFTRDSSSLKLPYNIDSWDSVSGKASVWVLLNRLDPFNNTQFIRLHTNSQDTSKMQVFDTSNGFEGVWHLEDSSSGIGTQNVYKDMTQNNYYGDDFVFSGYKDGVIGKGEQFNGMGDRIRLPQNISAFCNVPAISAEAWFRSSGSPLWQSIICVSDSDSTQPRMELGINNQGQIFVDSYILNSDLGRLITNSSYTDNNWHYVIGIVDFTTQEIIVYVDGVQAGNYTNKFLPGKSYTSKSAMSAIGSRATGTEYFMKGSLDEVRMSTVRRNPDWMKFCYMNQMPGSKVVTLRKVN